VSNGPADVWKPSQYEMFLDVRHRPGIDLMERAKAHWYSKHHNKQPQTIYDLGCGTGRLAAELAVRFPTSSVVGVDSSAAMLSDARKQIDSQQQASVAGRVSFVQRDVATFNADGQTDMIYSNAALHWIDSSQHDQLFARLIGQLNTGGLLAVQMPNNFDQPSHTLIHKALTDLKLDDNEKNGSCASCPASHSSLATHLLLQCRGKARNYSGHMGDNLSAASIINICASPRGRVHSWQLYGPDSVKPIAC